MKAGKMYMTLLLLKAISSTLLALVGIRRKSTSEKDTFIYEDKK